MFFIGAILRWAVLVGYLAGAFLYIAPLVSARFRMRDLGTPILVGTCILHTLLLLETGLEYGRLTFLRSALQAATLYALGLGLATLVVEARLRNRSFGAFAIPLAAILYIVSLFEKTPHTGIDPLLDSYWFEVHVMSAVVGYTAFGLAFVSAVMYLALAGTIRRRSLGAFFDRMPSLDTLDRLGGGGALVGFLFFSAAILSGAVWSGSATGKAVSGEPKELMSLLTWAIFALQLLLRWRAGWRGRRPALLAIVGFAACLATIFGGGGSGRHPL